MELIQLQYRWLFEVNNVLLYFIVYQLLVFVMLLSSPWGTFSCLIRMHRTESYIVEVDCFTGSNKKHRRKGRHPSSSLLGRRNKIPGCSWQFSARLFSVRSAAGCALKFLSSFFPSELRKTMLRAAERAAHESDMHLHNT